MRATVASSLFLLSVACAPHAGDGRHPRERLFPPLPASVAARAFPAGMALHVLYWPAGGCQSCNLPATRALSELVLARPDISVTIVVPDGFPLPAASAGIDWPGEVATLELEAYRRQMDLAPLPRLEVWDPQGQLLLLRSLPPNAVQAAAIGDEIVWAKAMAKSAGAASKGDRR